MFKKVWKLFLTRVLSDKAYVKYRYRRIFGKKLDLKNPKSLNEKLQFSKLYDRKDIYSIIADKYSVRAYIESKIGQKYMIPLYGVYCSIEQLFNEFPNLYPCIIKPTHDSGGGIILKSDRDFDRSMIESVLSVRLARNFYHETKEWEYKNIKPRIIVEKLLLDSSGNIPNDYKLNCFNGKCEFIYCSIDRSGKNYRKIYDRNWRPIQMTWCGPGLESKKFQGPDIAPPENLSKMIQIAEILASEFNYIRVDLYSVDSEIYFGELTRHHGGGFEPILPVEMDYYYGSLIRFS